MSKIGARFGKLPVFFTGELKILQKTDYFRRVARRRPALSLRYIANAWLMIDATRVKLMENKACKTRAVASRSASTVACDRS